MRTINQPIKRQAKVVPQTVYKTYDMMTHPLGKDTRDNKHARSNTPRPILVQQERKGKERKVFHYSTIIVIVDIKIDWSTETLNQGATPTSGIDLFSVYKVQKVLRDSSGAGSTRAIMYRFSPPPAHTASTH